MGTPSRATRAFTLIDMLIAVVIVAVLAAILLPRLLGGSTGGTAKPRSAITQTYDTVCASNLRQVQMAIDMARQTNDGGRPPQSLDELKLGPEITHCPAGHEAYVYDPTTGTVSCPHPGHEGLRGGATGLGDVIPR